MDSFNIIYGLIWYLPWILCPFFVTYSLWILIRTNHFLPFGLSVVFFSVWYVFFGHETQGEVLKYFTRSPKVVIKVQEKDLSQIKELKILLQKTNLKQPRLRMLEYPSAEPLTLLISQEDQEKAMHPYQFELQTSDHHIHPLRLISFGPATQSQWDAEILLKPE